jgi:hypothetical protein
MSIAPSKIVLRDAGHTLSVTLLAVPGAWLWRYSEASFDQCMVSVERRVDGSL